MKLRGGFSASSRSRNFSSAARGPSTSMKTPCGELLTQPASSSSVGQPEDERTEADALHRAANGEFQARALAGWSGFVHAGILSEPALN